MRDPDTWELPELHIGDTAVWAPTPAQLNSGYSESNVVPCLIWRVHNRTVDLLLYSGRVIEAVYHADDPLVEHQPQLMEDGAGVFRPARREVLLRELVQKVAAQAKVLDVLEKRIASLESRGG